VVNNQELSPVSILLAGMARTITASQLQRHLFFQNDFRKVLRDAEDALVEIDIP
jgi:hypothetical protein